MFKIWLRFYKCNKKRRKSFSFLRQLHLNCSYKFSQYWKGYLLAAVNVLRNIPKILLNTTGDIFQINFSQTDQNTWKKRSHGNFGGLLDTFTCWLSKRFLKRRFLESFLTKIFTVFNFGNTWAMTIIFFVQNV